MSKKKLTRLEVTKVSLVPRGANPGAHVMLFKSEEGEPAPAPTPQEEPVKKDISKMTPEELAAYAKELEGQVETLEKAKPTPEPKVEDVLKGLTPEARALVEKAQQDAADAQAAVAKAQEQAANAERIAKEEAEKREKNEFAQAVEKAYSHIPGTTVEKADLLFAVKKAVSAEVFGKIEALLKAADLTYAKLIVEKGHGEGGVNENDPMSVLNAKAEELMKADPRLERNAAFVKACEILPDEFAKTRPRRGAR